MRRVIAVAVASVASVASVVSAAPAKPAGKLKVPPPPHGASRIAIDYKWQSFTRDSAHYTLEWNGATYTAGTRAIEPALVDALYASLTQLHDVSEPARCFSHTDDYPQFTVTIDGDEPMTIASDSNCHAYVPWNVTRGDKTQAQYSGAIWRALEPVLAAAADRWKQGGNTPMATTSWGVEIVELGDYAIGGHDTGDAHACARSLETDAQAKQAFGDVHVTEARVACDLSASADCSATTAETTFLWQGLHASIAIPCTHGQVALTPALLAEYLQVGAFLQSKPVRALVKLGAVAPQLRGDGDWEVEAFGDGLPILTWRPGTTVIHARSVGDEPPSAPFWKLLGIDPKPLVKQRDGFAELVVDLDYAGKRVR
jgi:hypothetical protein